MHKQIFIMNKIYKSFESIKQALPYIISLSEPSKMETYGYSTSAYKCKQGSILNKIEGTVCHNCYARKGRYIFVSCQECLDKRLDKIQNEPYWVDAMIYILNHKKRKGKPLELFRWHDSGDLNSMDHLNKIIEIAKKTPNIIHWLPTKELGLIQEYVKTKQPIPKNLNIRISAFNINGEPAKIKNTTTSVVITKDNLGKTEGLDCPVYANPLHGKSCGSCTACYDINIKRINYVKH